MHAMTTSQSTSWDDRGRWAAFAAVAYTAGVAAYVFATFHNRSPLIPLSVSVLALFGNSQPAAVALRIVAMVVLFLFAAISMASIGLFYIPPILALVVAVAQSHVQGANKGS